MKIFGWLLPPWLSIPLSLFGRFFAGVWRFLMGLPRWAQVALLAILLGWLYGHHQFGAGQADTQSRWDESVRQAEKKAERVTVKRDAVTVKIVDHYIDRIQVVREKGATIVKEVPRYVPSTACPLPPGFRVLHDASVQNVVPDPAAIAHASAVPAQDAAATIADNYTACHATEAQLTALQEWVREQSKVK